MKKKESAGTELKPRKRRRWTKDDSELTLLALPTFVWYVLFCYLPMFGVIIAFKNYKITPGAGRPEWRMCGKLRTVFQKSAC